MNRYDYYTRCACVDEQEWLTEELYYPDGDDYRYHSDDCDFDGWDDYWDDDSGWENCGEWDDSGYDDTYDCEEEETENA